jgi:hypothetical protein
MNLEDPSVAGDALDPVDAIDLDDLSVVDETP